MADRKGYRNSDEYNQASVISGNKKVWFLNGDLVRVHHLNRSNGIMSVYNITKDRIESCLINDFKLIKPFYTNNKGKQFIVKSHGTNKILEYLCEELNLTETVFPSTKLVLFFKLVSS